MLRASCLALEMNEFRCYEAKIEQSEKAGSRLPGVRVPPVQYMQKIVRAGGCPAVVAQWQSTSGLSQRCPGFDSQQLPGFSISSIHLITSKFIH